MNNFSSSTIIDYVFSAPFLSTVSEQFLDQRVFIVRGPFVVVLRRETWQRMGEREGGYGGR